MTQTLDFQNAEKRVFRFAVFEDGIWEIYLGLFFILMSFYSVTREILGPAINAILALGLSLLLVAAAMIARKYIIQPRTGVVRFGPRTQKRIKMANLIVMGLVLATFVLLILSINSLISEPTWEQLPKWFSDFDIDLVFALVTIALFCLVAWYTGIPRFYLHGLLIGVGNFAATVLLVNNGIRFGWPLALAGLIIVLIGVFVLIKFLQTHPHPAEEVSDDR